MHSAPPPRPVAGRRAFRAAVLAVASLLLLAPSLSLAAAKPARPAKTAAKPAAKPAAKLSVSSRYRSPRNPQRPLRKSTRFIVLHTTEGAAKGALEKLSANGECHYVVDTEGRLFSIIDKGRVAYHAGLSMWDGRTGLDSCSVGIEVVGYHNKAPTAAQYATLKKLLAELKATYRVPDERVLTHSMVAYGNPNHWHRYRHRGRKRCAMFLASPAARAKLGLVARPAYDPDLRAGRLRDADPELTRALYAKAPATISPAPAKTADARKPASPKPPAPPATSAAATKPPSPAPDPAPAPADNVIGPRRSAWDIARDRYDSATTFYTYPNGARRSGAEIKGKEWKALPAGTVVTFGDDLDTSENANEGLVTIGVDGTAQELAGDAVADSGTFYFPPKKDYLRGSTLSLSRIDALPSGTRVLVGYKVAGPVAPRRPAFALCGLAWNRDDTYYWDPARKELKSGSDITERSIPKNAMIFYRRRK